MIFLVTGSSRGLGREIVRTALDAGHRVVATARNASSLDDLVAAHPDTARAVALDVTDPAAARAAVAVAVAEFGGLDVLVNNAGYADVDSIEDVDEARFRAQIETNLFGVVTMTRAALPVLREQGRGHVVQVSSVGGRLATPGLAAYQTAKWAVGGFSSVLAAEVAPLGIAVTVLEPGGMRTDWAGSSMTVGAYRPEYEPTVGASARMHGADVMVGDPVKVAGLVLRVAAMENPPLRLLAGPDAYRYATDAGRALLASDESLRELSESVAADDATPEQADPLGAFGIGA